MPCYTYAFFIVTSNQNVLLFFFTPSGPVVFIIPFCPLSFFVMKNKVTNKIMLVIFTAMATVTTVSLVGYMIFESENKDLYYLCYSDNSPVPLFR